MFNNYQVVERPPTLEEYRQLSLAVGWGHPSNDEVLEIALHNSLYLVVALSATETVGMGRIVGDGAKAYYLQDIAVLPEHQRKGVGTMITAQLMTYLKTHAPDNAYISLIASRDAVNLYKKHGFEMSPYVKAMYHFLRK